MEQSGYSDDEPLAVYYVISQNYHAGEINNLIF